MWLGISWGLSPGPRVSIVVTTPRELGTVLDPGVHTGFRMVGSREAVITGGLEVFRLSWYGEGLSLRSYLRSLGLREEEED